MKKKTRECNKKENLHQIKNYKDFYGFQEKNKQNNIKEILFQRRKSNQIKRLFFLFYK
jgi:hypothetical protein